MDNKHVNEIDVSKQDRIKRALGEGFYRYKDLLLQNWTEFSNNPELIGLEAEDLSDLYKSIESVLYPKVYKITTLEELNELLYYSGITQKDNNDEPGSLGYVYRDLKYSEEDNEILPDRIKDLYKDSKYRYEEYVIILEANANPDYLYHNGEIDYGVTEYKLSFPIDLGDFRVNRICLYNTNTGKIYPIEDRLKDDLDSIDEVTWKLIEYYIGEIEENPMTAASKLKEDEVKNLTWDSFF